MKNLKCTQIFNNIRYYSITYIQSIPTGNFLVKKSFLAQYRENGQKKIEIFKLETHCTSLTGNVVEKSSRLREFD